MRFRVIQPQGLSLDAEVFLSVTNIELFEVGVAVQNLVVVRNAVVFDPAMGADEPITFAAYATDWFELTNAGSTPVAAMHV